MSNGAVAPVDGSRTLQLTAIDAKTRGAIERVTGFVSPISPNPVASPDGERAWRVHNDAGKVAIADAQSSAERGSIDTGPVRSHVNFLVRADGVLAYVGVGASAGEVPELVGVDSTDVDAKGQVAGQRHLVALGAAGLRQVIADSRADADGNGQADPMLELFDSRLRRVLVAVAS